jgi:hypothetical protein
MTVLAILVMLIIPLGMVDAEHPEFYDTLQNGKSNISWKYVKADNCQSGLNEDGSYTIALFNRVYFKQVNKDGTVSKISCDKSDYHKERVKRYGQI